MGDSKLASVVHFTESLMTHSPSLEEIRSAAAALRGRIVETPTLTLNSSRIAPHLPEDSRAHMKMELFQQAGSFKARGVLLAVDALDEAQRAAGVTAVSAGNHALAVSWVANQAGISAKVVMPKNADPIRVEGCVALGAEVVFGENAAHAFASAEHLVQKEGRTMLHPFESPYMTLGAATCGLEFIESRPDMDVVLVPVGGGGFISGVSTAIKRVKPECEVIGIEPFGADSMWQSFDRGKVVTLDQVTTIADSLGAPMSLPNSYAITRQNVSEIVRIADDEMRRAMKLLLDALKILAEPACAATTAAATGPLRERLRGKNIGLIACGSKIGRAHV